MTDTELNITATQVEQFKKDLAGWTLLIHRQVRDEPLLKHLSTDLMPRSTAQTEIHHILMYVEGDSVCAEGSHTDFSGKGWQFQISLDQLVLKDYKIEEFENIPQTGKCSIHWDNLSAMDFSEDGGVHLANILFRDLNGHTVKCQSMQVLKDAHITQYFLEKELLIFFRGKTTFSLVAELLDDPEDLFNEWLQAQSKKVISEILLEPIKELMDQLGDFPSREKKLNFIESWLLWRRGCKPRSPHQNQSPSMVNNIDLMDDLLPKQLRDEFFSNPVIELVFEWEKSEEKALDVLFNRIFNLLFPGED